MLRCHIWCPQEIVLNVVTVLIVVIDVSAEPFLVKFLGLLGIPILTHIDHLALEIQLRVVVFSNTTQALVEREVLGMDCDTVVVLLATFSNVLPAALLLLEIEPCGVR